MLAQCCTRDDCWDTTKVGQAIPIAAQKNYIETVKKLYMMMVCDFVNKRLCQMASYLPEFPRPMAATALSETDLKNIIFRGMPNAWQENFNKLLQTLEETRILKAVVLVAEIVTMDAVTIQVEDLDIKDVLIKEEDVVRLTNVQVHGRHPITVAMKQRTIRVVTTVMLTLGSSAMVTLMDRIIGQGSLLVDLMEQQAVFRGGRKNGGDRNDAYQHDAATNASSNNNAPSVASTVTNHTNTSGWGAGNQSAKNAAADNHWIDFVSALE
eukprot:scaffold14274_cov49-Attheya_sp.AAC.6